MNKPAISVGADYNRLAAERSICSYTNDVARGRKSCQAAANTKNRVCRIKTHLPPPIVYKAGKVRRRGTPRLHVCIQTVSSKGIPHDILQRNQGLRGA